MQPGSSELTRSFLNSAANEQINKLNLATLPALCLGANSRMASATSASDLPENMADSFLTETGEDFFLTMEYSDALLRRDDDGGDAAVAAAVGTESCLSVEDGGRSLESASTASPFWEISGGGPNMETLRSLSRGMLFPLRHLNNYVQRTITD